MDSNYFFFASLFIFNIACLQAFTKDNDSENNDLEFPAQYYGDSFDFISADNEYNNDLDRRFPPKDIDEKIFKFGKRYTGHRKNIRNLLTVVNSGDISDLSATIELNRQKIIVNNSTIHTGVYFLNTKRSSNEQAQAIADNISSLSFTNKANLKMFGKNGRKKLINSIIKSIENGVIVIINSGTINRFNLNLPEASVCPTSTVIPYTVTEISQSPVTSKQTDNGVPSSIATQNTENDNDNPNDNKSSTTPKAGTTTENLGDKSTSVRPNNDVTTENPSNNKSSTSSESDVPTENPNDNKTSPSLDDDVTSENPNDENSSARPNSDATTENSDDKNTSTKPNDDATPNNPNDNISSTSDDVVVTSDNPNSSAACAGICTTNSDVITKNTNTKVKRDVGIKPSPILGSLEPTDDAKMRRLLNYVKELSNIDGVYKKQSDTHRKREFYDENDKLSVEVNTKF